MLDDQIFPGAPEDVTDSAWQLLIEVLCEVRTGGTELGTCQVKFTEIY